jgi:arginase
MSKIQIIENCSEIGAGTRGSSLSIDALKVASRNLKSNLFKKYKSVVVPNHNDVLDDPIKFPKAIRIESVIKVCESISSIISKSLSKHNFPLVLSGDHSNAAGTLSGIKSTYPDKRIGAVWIDAHADLHSPFTTPSGNVHGMSLAASVGSDNDKQRAHELDHLTQQQWEKYKNLENISPKVNTDDIVLVGLRSSEDPEDYFIIENNIKKISVEEVRRSSSDIIANNILKHLSSCDLIYISFDVDSLDCDLVSYGTGTPVMNGFTEQEASGIINHLLIDKRTCCLEVVEINPCLDNKQNKMAETALRILDQATSIVEKRG